MMIIRLLQNLPDLRQRETQLPSLPGKPQPPQILGIVVLIVVVRIADRTQQTFPGVEPDGIRVNPGGGGDFFDFHKQRPAFRKQGFESMNHASGVLVRGSASKNVRSYGWRRQAYKDVLAAVFGSTSPHQHG